MKPDFSGYVTRYDVRCSDGVTIKPGAFKAYHNKEVALVWNHSYGGPENVLGHVRLEHRDDGVYGRAYLNESPNAQLTRDLVLHGDIKAFSIAANGLTKKGNDVLHGKLREVSVTISGANEGAFIDYVSVQHGNNDEEVFDGVLYFGDPLSESEEEPAISHNTEENNVSPDKETTEENTDNKTIEDVLSTLTEEQRTAVNFVFEQLLEGDDESEEDDASDEEVEESNDEKANEVQQSDLEGDPMPRNIFDNNEEQDSIKKNSLTHSELQTIVDSAKQGGSLKEAFLQHAGEYGITDIDLLFPDAKSVTPTPELLKRDTSWVASVMADTKKSPFARVKSHVADLTGEEARARGYTKGGLKVEEVFTLLKRTTSPTTIYKKQKLDRDDVLDITDLDVIAWMKGEMRLMLDEELARAILVGDGRTAIDPDKIKDPEGALDGIGIRSIYKDHQLYAETVEVPDDYATDPDVLVDKVIRSRKSWKGSGVPSFYTKIDIVADLLLLKDTLGRRIYNNEAELAGAMRVARLVEVEVMEEYENLLGIMVNLVDYTLGANKGGELNFFDDFDIDYNQMKYLYETRLSGALTKPKSAIIFVKAPVETPPEG